MCQMSLAPSRGKQGLQGGFGQRDTLPGLVWPFASSDERVKEMSLDLCDTDGTLYKWTNYWGGWQPRWFALSNGILAYYNSYEETDKGCKASLNVSAGEVKVHPTDNTRFDIVLQHDQHWYLKASTPAERQKWLIALGTAKARKCEFSAVKEIESGVAKGEIQTKVSELRLYCDVLLNQVKQLKTEAEEKHPDVNKLTEASSMLVATCDTFVSTLTQCMKMAEHSFLPSSRPKSPDETPLALPLADMHRFWHKEKHGSVRSMSVDERSHTSKRHKEYTTSSHALPDSYSAPNTPGVDVKTVPSGDAAKTLAKLNITNTPIPSNKDDNSTRREPTTPPPSPSDESQVTSDSFSQDNVDNGACQEIDPADSRLQKNHIVENGTPMVPVPEERQLTFFSGMLHSFRDIVLEEDRGVPTIPFLDACENLLPFFDAIGSTAFAPVKMDLSGNIKKIRTKQLNDPVRYCTLQNIVRHELDTKTTKVRNSATDALLWLKRGLRFIQVFLGRLKDGEKDVTVALNFGYASTLKVYHGWVVKGIFALALKAAPYHSDLMKALSTDSFPYDSPNYISVLMQDIDEYLTALDVVLNMIDSFYEQNKLEDKTVV